MYVVERIALEIATADPGLDLPVARIDGQKTGLNHRFLLSQVGQERGIGRELADGVLVVDVWFAGLAEIGCFADENPDQIVL